LNLDATGLAGIDVDGADSGSTFNLRINDSQIDNDVVMDITGSSAFLLLVDNTDITTGAEDAFALNFTGAQNGDVTIRNDSDFTAGNGNAFVFTANGTNVDVDLRMDGGTFTNSSAQDAVSYLVNGGATLDATVTNNTFGNGGAGDDFAMTSDGSTTRIDLNLDNNTATVYELTTANNGGGFNFGVVDRDNADANNAGTVNFNPAIGQFEDIMESDVDLPAVP
jgi:hypothetical protein